MNPELIEQYKILHERSPSYGSGATYLNKILAICKSTNCRTALDYGCGKGILADKLNENGIQCDKYDPAIPEYDTLPNKKYDIVIANDVLEHLHRNSFMGNIRTMYSLSKKLLFFNISCREAKFFLPNGKNCHTLIASPDWWVKKLCTIKNTGKNFQKFHEPNQNLEIVITLDHGYYCYDCDKPMLHFETTWACPKCEKSGPQQKNNIMFTEEHFKKLDEMFGSKILKLRLDHMAILENKLTKEQWVVFINELEYIMRENIEEHMPILKSMTLEQGKAYLFLKSETKHRLQAFLIAIDFWFQSFFFSFLSSAAGRPVF